MTTLLDLLDRLPAGARLDSTSEYKAITGTSLHNATSQRARTRIIALNLHRREAELSPDGTTINVYGSVKFFPWPALVIRSDP